MIIGYILVYLLIDVIYHLYIFRDHLATYYYEWAFLRSERHTSALFICLSALDNNSETFLAHIDPKLVCYHF